MFCQLREIRAVESSTGGPPSHARGSAPAPSPARSRFPRARIRAHQHAAGARRDGAIGVRSRPGRRWVVALLLNVGPGVLLDFGPPAVPQPTVSLDDPG